MKIWLASYPRSGSTYIRTLLNRFYGLYHTSIYDENINRGTTDSKAHSRSTYLANPEQAPGDHPLFVKTHEMPNDKLPAIYLVRDGRDALVSYAWYIVNFKRKPESEYRSILRNLILSPDYFGGWGTHVLAWKNRPAPTAVIKFEEIVTAASPDEILEKAFDQINFRDFKKKEVPHVPTFKSLQDAWPVYFRKGRVGNWKDEMPPAFNTLFWKNHGAAMKEMGYTDD